MIQIQHKLSECRPSNLVVLGPGDDDEEDEAVEDSQGPSSATEGVSGSVDCVGCSSAEDENEVCPSPIQPKGDKL